MRLAALLLLLAAPLAAQERVIRIGQTVSGQLTGADPVGLRARKAPYHVWTMDGRRGQRIVIDLRSDAFDSYLVLRDEEGFVIGSDDDGGGNNNARLHTVLPRDGRYRIVVTAFRDSSTGPYELTVSGWEAPPAAAPGATASINLGESKDGILEPGDEIAGDGPYTDRWTVNLRAGQRARADLHSTDFDSYVIVRDPDGTQVASDDDSGGNKDASATFRALSAGVYTVIVTSFDDNTRIGAYRLTLAEDNGDFGDPGASQAITDGQTKDGRLESGDVTGRRGLEDHWTFQGRQGQLARIDVMSTAFDSYLTLMYNGMAIDSNDDGGEGQNARLMEILPGTGTYTIAVSSYNSRANGGRYRVALAFSDPPAGAGRIEQLTPGQRVSGRLEPGDRPRGSGGYEDLWEFQGHSGQDVMIEMHSSEFDSYLELRDAEGAMIAENDDGGEGNDALILTRLPREGRYRVVARAYGDRQVTGVYELTLSAGGDIARPGRVGELHEGQMAMGRLESGDSVVGDSTYADIYTFRAPRDGEVQIDLRSGDFDAYLIVKDASGTTLATDDDSGDGTNSRITLAVRQGDTYRIFANSYGDDRATGLYRLSLKFNR
ncbi:MAG TPA: pre-peptidase C-terminal domain-containing protein [Gemmatimonadales bacterium]